MATESLEAINYLRIFLFVLGVVAVPLYNICCMKVSIDLEVIKSLQNLLWVIGLNEKSNEKETEQKILIQMRNLKLREIIDIVHYLHIDESFYICADVTNGFCQ